MVKSGATVPTAGPAAPLQVQLLEDGRLAVQFVDAGGKVRNVAIRQPLPVDQWQSVAVRCDGRRVELTRLVDGKYVVEAEAAIGKSASASEVDQTRVVIRFGSQEVYPARLDETGLAALAKYMRGTDVRIHVSLATGGDSSATVWGCDLTDGYVRINADYTT